MLTHHSWRYSRVVVTARFMFMTALMLLSMSTLVVAGFNDSVYISNIYFYNTDSTELIVQGTVYNQDGSIIGTPNTDLFWIGPHETRRLTAEELELAVSGTSSSEQGWLEINNNSDNLLVRSLIRRKVGGPLINMSTEVEKTVGTNDTSIFKVLGIPSIQSDYFRNGVGYVIFCNTGTISTPIRGTLYYEDGNVVGTPESILIPELSPKETIVMDLYQLAKAVNGGPTAGILWLEVEADSEDISIQLLVRESELGIFGRSYLTNMSAEVKKENSNATSFFNIFNIPTAGANDVGIILFYNTGTTPATVRGTLYNLQGHVVGTPNSVLITSTDFIPKKMMTLYAGDLAKIFDDVDQTFGRLWLKAQADSENISIQLLHRNKMGGPWSNNSSEVKGEVGNTLFKLLGVPNSDARDIANIYIYNTGTTATELYGALYDQDGDLIFSNSSLLSLSLDGLPISLAPKSYTRLTTTDIENIGGGPFSGRGTLWINTNSAVFVQLLLREKLSQSRVKPLTNHSSTNSNFIPIGFASPSSLNTPPIVSDITKVDNITFIQSDFTNVFTDVDGDRLTYIRIESLPEAGILKLNDIAVNVDDEIKVEELDNLTFTPNEADWHGSTHFDWNGRDFTLYADKKAVTHLVITPLTLEIDNIGMEGGSGTVIASAGVNNGFNCQSGAHCVEEYQYGSTVTLTVIPDDNSTFLGWVGGCSDGEAFTITSNMSCIAVFDQDSKVTECLDNSVTIETSSSGNWNSSATWQRLAGNELPNEPTENDIVRINSLHTIIAPFYAIKVKALCIKTEAMLTSFDDLGTPLEIQASDYFINHGIVVGKAGANESVPCTDKEAVGTNSCAMPGADVIVKVDKAIQKQNEEIDGWLSPYDTGGPILNTGQIIAGKGGDASQYAAPGGNAIVLGRNTTNEGIIQAGHGGNILGIDIGESGRGGSTQILGSFGGYGNLYNQNGAQALAGDGGNCNPDAIALQESGAGGNLWLFAIPSVYLNDGILRSGSSGANCSSTTRTILNIEPSIIDLSGAKTTIEGGNIAIYGGNNWVLDLSNLSGTVVKATGNITLAVGEGGVIDFRGSKGTILEAEGSVELFSDEILLDDNVNPSDLIQANHIAVDSSKILRQVSLTGPNKLRWEPEVALPVHVTLANNGPEADTYTLSVTDSAGWISNQLPATIEVEGLEAIDLVLNVIPPATRGETDTITIIATSQSDPNITATVQVQVFINPEPMTIPQPVNESDTSSSQPSENAPDEIDITYPPDETPTSIPTIDDEKEKEAEIVVDIMGPESTIVVPVPPTTPPCPTTGIINWMCINNPEQVLTDITVESEGNLSGGILAGIINNKGLISQVTIQPEAIVSGGTLTGYIQNEGTLTDFEFVGAEIRGGTLSGTINNHIQIGGTFKDVMLAAHTRITGGTIAGDIQGDCEAPAQLERVTVKSDTQLSCVILDEGVLLATGVTFQDVQIAASLHFIDGNLQGNIINDQVTLANNILFQDIYLAAGSNLSGTSLQGKVMGDINEPAWLENVEIKTGSYLSWVILGNEVKLDKGVRFGEGVQIATADGPKLPQLGAIGINTQSETMSTATLFSGGISVNNGKFKQQVMQKLTDLVAIRGHILVEREHVGEQAEAVVYGRYQPLDEEDRSIYFMLDDKSNVLPWDENLAQLATFKTWEQLAPIMELAMYEGTFKVSGTLDIFFGYRLKNGTIIHNRQAIEVIITEAQ